MKKSIKSNLARMATLLPELDAEHQKGILGGTGIAIGSSDYDEMVCMSTVVALTVDPYAVTESESVPISTASVSMTTVSPVVSTMPVPTVTMAPMETSVPEEISSIAMDAHSMVSCITNGN